MMQIPDNQNHEILKLATININTFVKQLHPLLDILVPLVSLISSSNILYFIDMLIHEWVISTRNMIKLYNIIQIVPLFNVPGDLDRTSSCN